MTAAALRPVAIKLDDDTKARLKRLADARHRTSHRLEQGDDIEPPECHG